MADAGGLVGRGRTADVIALSGTKVIKLFQPGIAAERVEGEFERSGRCGRRHFYGQAARPGDRR